MSLMMEVDDVVVQPTVSSTSLKVIVQDLSNNPQCDHGPTLLFSRVLKGGSQRTFYACSACRDRRDCSFFMWSDEKKHTDNIIRTETASISDVELRKRRNRMTKIRELPANKLGYCHTCGSLFNVKRKEKHASHEILEGLSDYQIRHPSQILKPAKCTKKEAQYLFSSQSVTVICEILKGLDVTFVICIGAPRVHEYILDKCSPEMSSILLDIDKRYYDFYEASEFIRYNMFNNHIFDGKESQKTFIKIISTKKHEVAIAIDPPFGGRVEPLAYTLRSLQKLRTDSISSSKPMPVLWAFPYFMEPYIQGNCPDFTMLDYKVNYDNHPQFKTGKGKRGSPVRLFTNVSPSKIPLPEKEGYHYCNHCDRWVSNENKHCYKCNLCPSKDGRTYVHCNLCKRCVKPSWVHCGKCGRCCLPNHQCGVKPPPPIICFCGSSDHTKKYCPLLPKVPSKGLKRKDTDVLKNVAHRRKAKFMKTQD